MTLKNTILALFTTVLFISCSSDSSTDDLNLEENLTITQEIHKLVNEYRVSKGKATVEFNDAAAKIALTHTEYMISINKINHDKLSERFKELQVLDNAKAIAENVASRQKTAFDVVQGWINSDGHRKNIEGNYTHTGIGVKKGANGHYFFTQIFYSK
ncbi:CAP domain-containing protein [Tenacibaculum sp. Bg11-29]|uniref:CAP domain-containing protein n=1 Tax=Tenacibaculum sp. Bg11-29 TaxID=2058306 RepID=UPI000C32B411|nr:CAP domain-containing protein [Tenacibaculum sp. Bg11-29]PKH51716.1 CAP domain-containing protein [Tenacibaculum sp. Bg11-29]